MRKISIVILVTWNKVKSDIENCDTYRSDNASKDSDSSDSSDKDGSDSDSCTK